MSKKKYTPDDLMKHYISTPTESQREAEKSVQGGSADRQTEKESQETRRKRVQKLPRINMAFTEDNLEYLQIISTATGKSITQYVNDLVREEREVQGDLITQMKRLMKEIKGK